MLHLLAFADKPPVDVSEHIDQSTLVLWLAFGLLVAFFALRPELWRRMWFRRIDPRPVGLLRIAVGISALWTFLDFLAIRVELFTDEGLYITEMARSKFGGDLRRLWDPQHGFENWTDLFKAMWGKFTPLHMRSDPPFVNFLFGSVFVSLGLVIVGFRTRLMTVISWVLVNWLYNYSPIFLTGGDTALRTFLFLCMFLRWGEAYSVDGWIRRRRAILRGAEALPKPRPIPAWPTYLLMLQLTCIYFATGLLKSGNTWFNGHALYYAMNLDHFYRVQWTGLVAFMHFLGLTQLGTWITHYWERLFPLALLGVMLRGWELDRARGLVPHAALGRRVLSWICLASIWAIFAYIFFLVVQYYYHQGMGGVRLEVVTVQRMVLAAFAILPPVCIWGYLKLRRSYPHAHHVLLNWLLGKRLWLTLGLLFHAGIDISMNVGTFVQVMVAPYFAWVTGKDVDGLWRWWYWRPANIGEVGRPRRARWALLQRFFDRLGYRVRPPAHIVRYGADEGTIRRVALLRVWDLGETFDYELDPKMAPGQIRVEGPSGAVLEPARVQSILLRACPGLWWLRPLSFVPPLRALGAKLIGLPKIVGA